MAEDAFVSREVAIKVADTNVLQDPTHGRRYKKLFLNEASLAGKLKHPHIASIHDAGVDDDRHYLVMEYVPGGTSTSARPSPGHVRAQVAAILTLPVT